MANVRNANTWYVDTATSEGTDLEGNFVLVAAIITTTSANSRLVLNDASKANATKMDLRLATNGESHYFDFSLCPVVFPTGIRASVVSNVDVTLIFRDTGKGTK